MSYSRPSASAASASWFTEPAYSRPSASAASATWYDAGGTIPRDAPGVAPTGGVGIGTRATIEVAPSVAPEGGVGVGEVRYYFRALGVRSGGVGLGDRVRPSVGEAPGVCEARVGLAYSFRTLLGLRNLFAYAPGTKSGGVGVATADLPLAGVAQGVAPTGGVGAGTSRATHFAGGVDSRAAVGVGQARLVSRFSAPAVESTAAVGVARAGLHFFAPGVYRPTRFGAAYLTLGWAFVAPAVVTGNRVGAGAARFNVRNIPGVAPTTGVGPAEFAQGHRAPHIPPSTGVGRGQLTRTPSC